MKPPELGVRPTPREQFLVGTILEDAAQQPLEEARGIRSIWVQNLQAVVAYRVNCKLSFVVESEDKKAPAQSSNRSRK